MATTNKQLNNSEEPNVSSFRKELAKLDEQIDQAKQIQKVLEEEQKPMYTVYTWEAPERIFVPKGKQWYLVLATVTMVVIVFAALTNNFGLIFAIIALVLLVYALNTVPPKQVTHELTNKGVNTFGSLHQWKNIENFWITKRGEVNLLNLEINDRKDSLTEKLIILIGDGDLSKIVSYLSQHVDYLPSSQVSTNPLSKLTEGEYIPMSSFIE